MRKTITCISFFFLFAYAFSSTESLKELLKRLDYTITQQEVYVKAKEQRLSSIKKMLREKPLSNERVYELHFQLIQEYQPYKTDSALSYIERNLNLGIETANSDWINETNIRRAIIFAINGMFNEAEDILKSINTSTLHTNLRLEYYGAYGRLYEYLSQNSTGEKYIKKYEALSDAYKDSSFFTAEPNTDAYTIIYGSRLLTQKKTEKALELLVPNFEKIEKNTHGAAIMAYLIANAYRDKGNADLTKKYFALSAISDIQAAIKENSSLKELAIILFKEGDIDHAYEYLKFALDDATFANAKHRQIAISEALPIIDKSYRIEQQKSRRKLFILLVFISILAFFLIVSLVLVYRQKEKTLKARKELARINENLNSLNQKINLTNNKLKNTNDRLREANHIKEEYIGHFMNLCSIYIDKLDEYRKLVSRKIVANQIDDLQRMNKSRTFIEDQLKEFYTNFDNTFLHLFPTFVNEFNLLLREKERFNLKQGEAFNPELRIFALIRLGITDSFKIANFLRYSSQTIYNYRSKVRNKALVDRDDFEQEVAKIGTIKRVSE
jgi:cell division protein FtsB